MAAKGRVDTVYKPCAAGPALSRRRRPGRPRVAGHRVLQLTPLPQAPGPGVIDAGGRIGRNFAPERQQENVSLFGALADHIRAKRAKRGRSSSPAIPRARASGCKGLMEDEGLRDARRDRRHPRRRRRQGRAATSPSGRWSTGSRAPAADRDLGTGRAGRPADPRPEEAAPAENFLTEAQALSPGDLVVHVDHGVGRYTGLETITALGRAA